MDKVNVRSRNTSTAQSEAVTPRQGPIYLQQEPIGEGAFGRVYKLVDVSTGEPYAGKAFFRSVWNREVAIMRKVKHVGVLGYWQGMLH